MTDSAGRFRIIGKKFKQHSSVNHYKGEYVRGNVTSNSAESYHALLKRGLYGTFHFVGKQHLGTYCEEFNFRWTHNKKTNAEMVGIAVKQGEGKRLTYKNRIKEVLE